jgi:hypothetical protein
MDDFIKTLKFDLQAYSVIFCYCVCHLFYVRHNYSLKFCVGNCFRCTLRGLAVFVYSVITPILHWGRCFQMCYDGKACFVCLFSFPQQMTALSFQLAFYVLRFFFFFFFVR